MHNILQAALWAVLGFTFSWMLFHTWLQLRLQPVLSRKSPRVLALNTLFIASATWTGMWLIAVIYNALQFVGVIDE